MGKLGANQMKFNVDEWKVVLWGHKLHSHTHSYIHNAFYRAFEHLGAKVYWYDDFESVAGIDFSKTLFITEGQVDKHIPLRDDCFYVLHNVDGKYKELFQKNRCVDMQVYTDNRIHEVCDKIAPCTFFDVPAKCFYMMWGTDLLPDEIEKNKPPIVFNKNSKMITWVGTIGGSLFGNIDQITPFQLACEKNGITFRQWVNRSIEENITLIKESYLAPTIVGKWQHEQGYVPCRIFKNISYGQLGLTNSPRVAEVFDGRIVHNNDTAQLFYDARNYAKKMPLSELHALMDFVKNNHTYLNRIDTILDFISRVNPEVGKDMIK